MDAQAISGTQVLAYRGANFSGRSQAFGVGSDRADRGQLSTVGNDAISSLKVPTGYELKACQHEGDGSGAGTCRTFAAGDYGTLSDLDNQISLLQVSVAAAPTPTPSPSPTPSPDAGLVKTTYTADTTTNFPNPERGFCATSASGDADGDVSDGDCAAAKRQGSTLRFLFITRGHRNRPYDQAFLNHVDTVFNQVRSCGVKMYPIFMYNFPGDGSDSAWNPSNPPPDAPLDVVLGHIRQLAPLFKKHADVIAYVAGGFIGAWGEWHHSSNGLDTPKARRAVIDEMLRALPTERMYALRRTLWKTEYLGNATPRTPAGAFDGSAQARLDNENQCFLAVPGDEGITPAEKQYQHDDNRFVVQSGETCAVNKPRTDCPNALTELEQQRWSVLNAACEPQVLQGWKDQGCFEEIARKLVYRYRMIESSLLSSVTRGGKLSLSMTVTNDGWARAYNPRAVEIILRNKSTGQKVVIQQPASTDREQDPRFWLPGETHTISVSGYSVPIDLPTGDYEVLLNLPDPMASLRDRPEYSIRLANVGTWEAATGHNKLLRSIQLQ